MARAPLPPCTFSTTKVALMYLPRCFDISRRKTSLPPPGLEWVTSVTTWCGYAAGCAPASLTDNPAKAARPAKAAKTCLSICSSQIYVAIFVQSPARIVNRSPEPEEERVKHGTLAKTEPERPTSRLCEP